MGSAQHRAWLADQADALQYRRQMAELDAYAGQPQEHARPARELHKTLMRAVRLQQRHPIINQPKEAS